ncbi:MAG: DNA methyltransferase, partial [Verrucomicrobiota bacterium]
MPDAPPAQITAFIARWQNSGAAERANYVLFLSELCDLLDLPRPDPSSPDNSHNAYVFERAIARRNPDGTTSTGFIDLYRRGSLVLESKQGTNAPGEAENPFAAAAAPTKTGHGKRGTAAFDKALERAYHQARGYITALPPEEGRPPFLIVCDVGHTIDLYAEFTGTGGQYERFPDPVSHRITLPDLHRPEIRERLRKVWLDPHALDPSKVAAAITRDIAGRLALLAKSLEADGHNPQVIAGFLQRCLFTMFAEDVGLLPEDGFKNLLERIKDTPRGFPVMVSGLWREMATGTEFSALLMKEIACFNGGLFENTTALPVSTAQLAMLIEAAGKDWSAVEPSIFGTLLTRALDSRERHKLGAEYTPRAYVERLIRPTIIGPLRDEWDAVRVAAATLHEEADKAETQADQLEADAKVKMAAGASDDAKQLGAEAARLRKDADKRDAEALQQVIAFHRHLCKLRILDPACGTANFLYVTMEHMKRLEAEVLELVAALGGDAGMEMHGFRVRPEQFIGLELNQQAVAIAQLVLWIGYFQWQRKTTGKADTGDRPLLPKDKSIFEQDAVLAYDARLPRRDPQSGEILTVWNGYTTKPHPVTGKEVPDESARRALFDYTNPRRAEWPQADYITGNPPFIGTKRMIDALGVGYAEALRKAWKGSVPESADFVMFWWQKAAELVRDGKAKKFGFITTNSIHQTFNRRVIEPFLSATKNPLHLTYAIPDHPWIDSADGAAVRIAMTVAAPGHAAGLLEKVISEHAREDGENEVTLSRSGGVLAANLQIGADLGSAVALASNDKVAGMGVALHGAGFILQPEEAEAFRASGPQAIKAYLGGADLLRNPRERYLIDFSFMTEAEALALNPAAYQHVLNHVKPERDQNRRAALKDNWWKFGWERPVLRKALVDLARFIGTTETSKHRVFQFIHSATLADHKILCVACGDAYSLAVLSSIAHVVWAFATGGRLGVGNDSVYNKTRCFDPFPFPATEEGTLKQRIRDLGERLDMHRKRQQELYPDLTLTGIYNVLEKLRTGAALDAKDRAVHDHALVSVLKQIHDDLDAAVLEAYGWMDLGRDLFPNGPCAGNVRQGPFSERSACGEREWSDPKATPFSPPAPGRVGNASLPIADLLARGGPDAEALEQQILTRLVALNHERAAEEKRGL